MRKILFLVLALSLAAFICGCSNVVATVNGQTITQKELDKELEKTGGKAMLDNLVTKKLVEMDAQSKHIAVSDQEVEKQLDQVKKSLAPVDQQSLSGDKLQDFKDQIQFNLLLEKTIMSNVPQTEAKSYYEKNKDVLPEVELSVIVSANADQAKAILEELKRGRDFSSMASQYSLDQVGREHGGYVGYVSKGNLVQISPALAQTAFSLKPGELSQVIKTQKGYYVLKVLNKKESFDELKDEIQKQMAADRLKTYLQNLRDTAKIDYKGKFAQK